MSTKERNEQKIRQGQENQNRKTEDKTTTSRKHITKQSQLIKTTRIEDPENICTNNFQEPQIRQRIQEKSYTRKIIEIEDGENINNHRASDTPIGEWGFNRRTPDSNVIYGNNQYSNNQYGRNRNGNKYGGKHGIKVACVVDIKLFFMD